LITKIALLKTSARQTTTATLSQVLLANLKNAAATASAFMAEQGQNVLKIQNVF
jgi:hypothetical protein